MKAIECPKCNSRNLNLTDITIDKAFYRCRDCSHEFSMECEHDFESYAYQTKKYGESFADMFEQAGICKKCGFDTHA